MQNILNVAIIQAPGWLLGPQSRMDWLKSAIHEFDDRGVDLLVLPELYLTGYNIGEKVQLWAEKREGLYSKQIG